MSRQTSHESKSPTHGPNEAQRHLGSTARTDLDGGPHNYPRHPIRLHLRGASERIYKTMKKRN